MLSASVAFGQKKADAPAKDTHKKTTAKVKEEKIKKICVFGNIKTLKNKSIKGVQAFVYKPDTSIVASGFTDTSGKFETNGVVAGPYAVKVVYPNKKIVWVTGVDIKDKCVELNLKMDAPAEDSTLEYKTLMPPPPAKKDAKDAKKK